jgi:uncharacterized protein YfbU (UPF0304 family)
MCNVRTLYDTIEKGYLMNAQAMTERFEMRLDPAVLEQVDAWRARQGDVPSRSEAVRRLVDAGLAASGSEKEIRVSDGEKLVLLMLCDLFKQLKVKSDIDPAFVEAMIYGGHYWGLSWKYPGIYHGHEDRAAVVSETVDILDMWYFIERGYKGLSKKERDRVAAEAEPLGSRVVFSGFDGNNESEYLSVAGFLIKQLDRFTEFEGRNLNAHTPTIDIHRRMLSVFKPMRIKLAGRELNASEIIELLKERIHPTNRKPEPTPKV